MFAELQSTQIRGFSTEQTPGLRDLDDTFSFARFLDYGCPRPMWGKKV